MGTHALARFVAGCVGGTVRVTFHDAVAKLENLKEKSAPLEQSPSVLPRLCSDVPLGASHASQFGVMQENPHASSKKQTSNNGSQNAGCALLSTIGTV
jgi:hypothetical protein